MFAGPNTFCETLKLTQRLSLNESFFNVDLSRALKKPKSVLTLNVNFRWKSLQSPSVSEGSAASQRVYKARLNIAAVSQLSGRRWCEKCEKHKNSLVWESPHPPLCMLTWRHGDWNRQSIQPVQKKDNVPPSFNRVTSDVLQWLAVAGV